MWSCLIIYYNYIFDSYFHTTQIVFVLFGDEKYKCNFTIPLL